MNSLYKRLVTIGMISFTALLGWIYCIIEFRNKPVYIILVSLALIISVYVLLQSVISLRQRKDRKLKKDINEAVAKLVADFYEAQSQAETPDNTLEVERICKALYVQLRKVNTTLSNDLITKELLNNATKVNIKYHHADSSKLLAAITDLSDTLKLAPEPQVIVKEVPVAAPAPAPVAAEPEVAKAPEPVVEAPAPEPVPEPTPVEEPAPAPADDGGMLSQAEMDALIANMTSFAPDETEEPEIQAEIQIETPANVGASSAEAQHFFDEFETKHEHNNEETKPEPVAEPEPSPAASTPADDGGMLSQAEMDALIASMTGGASEPEPTPEPEPAPVAAAPANDGGKLSQAEMDALIASMTGGSSAPEPEPVAELEPAPAASAPADDGGMLSQAEMDALIASMTGGASEPEPEPEAPSNVLEFPTPAPAPEPAPVTDDPNKVLSPDEIAALFNSMK